jgi:hypothetical protein
MRSHLARVYYELGRVCKVFGLGPESKNHFKAAVVLTCCSNVAAWRASVP